MAFFARPNLDDTQFKQLEGSLLSLSGQTQIATPTGLTLATGTTNSGGVIITASGASSATNNHVLTYDSTDNVIKLKVSSVSGGTGVYDGASPTTCTVGGLCAGTNIFNTGFTEILQRILVPNIAPLTANTSVSFAITPSTLLYEVGTVIDVTGSTSFNAGCINPLYSSGGSVCVGRSCGASGYSYNIYGNPATIFTLSSFPSNSCVFPSHSVTAGNNTLSAVVCYSGGTQPYYSDCCTTYGSALPAGTQTSSPKTICGTFPWFYGSTSSAPILTGGTSEYSGTTGTCAQCLITGATGTCVGTSTGSIVVDNYSVIGKYIWFAIPSGATNTKTVWDGGNSLSNCGTIPGDLFQAECVKYIYSPNDLWGTPTSPNCNIPIPYKFYVSNYPTSIDYTMTYKNS